MTNVGVWVGRGYNRVRRAGAHPQVRRLGPEAEVYGRLDPAALLFDRIRIGSRPRSVNLLLPTIRPDELSAGPATAVRFAGALARSLQLPVQIMTTSRFIIPFPWHVHALRRRFDLNRLRVSHVGRGKEGSASPADIWVVTTWQTALAARTAVKLGLIEPAQVVYLIQDYEPGFMAWSTAFAAARMTYHSGFLHVVNSSPLADHLSSQEGPVVDPAFVMGPDLDLGRLQQVAESRLDRPRAVFFYARTNQRNMLELGLASLARAGDLCKVPWLVALAGEDGQVFRIPGVRTESLGRVTMKGYFELMARTQIAFSLMMSPHPSHPPLDWATSGGWAITNEFARAREGIHPRIISRPADPDLLGESIARCVEDAEIGQFLVPAKLGRHFGDVVVDVAQVLQ